MLKGNQRSDEFDYPDAEWRYFYFAERFGWTPAQVDDQPAVLLDWLQGIGGIVDQVKSESFEK